MERLSLEKETVHLDYTREGIPESVKNFRPNVFRDGDMYHCILGCDGDTAVFGSGNSIEEALLEWDHAYQDKMKK
ncbi:hypothetical protein [Chitinophaga ginsengisoli]|uniref:Uncharacterized protein n=1 Tax=Chitinophaga ginsengisoli TaxID=363837 RepID=A0A2P8GLI5_9BACT|nr:hypothetical protein [Chitinophaga ginsengisoli]PSL34823.1 hypothetical protein CLV42_102396 [Chitinophaga ginsengisoli]